MGDWKAEAGGTTPGEMDPVLVDVTTSWGMGTCLFLYHNTMPRRGIQQRQRRWRKKRRCRYRTRYPISSGCLPLRRMFLRPRRPEWQQHLLYDVRRPLPFSRPVDLAREHSR